MTLLHDATTWWCYTCGAAARRCGASDLSPHAPLYLPVVYGPVSGKLRGAYMCAVDAAPSRRSRTLVFRIFAASSPSPFRIFPACLVAHTFLFTRFSATGGRIWRTNAHIASLRSLESECDVCVLAIELVSKLTGLLFAVVEALSGWSYLRLRMR